jgi:hypothetical protein
MTGPAVSTASWPGLGFDPVPGNAQQVGAMTQQLAQVAKVLGFTHQGLAEIQSGRGMWEGAGAQAFAEKFGPLPRYLDDAAKSLSRATQVLDRWHGYLSEQQQAARQLEADAVAARRASEASRAEVDTAWRDPVAALFGQAVPPEVLPRVQAAAARIEQAQRTLTAATESLEALLAKGRQMLGEHDREAHDVAQRIRAADDGLTPPEPRWFEQAMTWIGEHLDDIGDVAGAISAIAGLLALFPPLTPIAGPVAVVAAGVALVADVGDTTMKGQWANPDSWGKVALDVVGLVPGVKGVWAAGKAAREGAEGVSLARRIGDAAGQPGLGTKFDYVTSGLPQVIDRVVPEPLRPAAADAVKWLMEGDKRLHRPGDRIDDIGGAPEGQNDWGAGMAKDAVHSGAADAKGVVGQAGDLARSVAPDLDGVITDVQGRANAVIDSASSTAEQVIDTGRAELDERLGGPGVTEPVTPEELDRTLGGAGIGRPMQVGGASG